MLGIDRVEQLLGHLHSNLDGLRAAETEGIASVAGRSEVLSPSIWQPRWFACLLAAALVLTPMPARCASAVAPHSVRAWRIPLERLAERHPDGEQGIHVTVADLDGDGRKELVGVNSRSRVHVWRWTGSRFRLVRSTRRLLPSLDWYSLAVCRARARSGRGDELLVALADVDGLREVRAYRWTSGRPVLVRRRPMSDEVFRGLLALGGPTAAERSLVVLESNAESPQLRLLFHDLYAGAPLARPGTPGSPGQTPRQVVWPGGIQGTRAQGAAGVDLDGDGKDELVLGLSGHLQDMVHGPGPAVPRLFVYGSARHDQAFRLQYEWHEFPLPLTRLFGAGGRGRTAFLLGASDDRVTICRWDGGAFRAEPAAVQVHGYPIAAGDLLGTGGCQVVSVEEGRALWVTPVLPQ